jgi:hypothetical protein
MVLVRRMGSKDTLCRRLLSAVLQHRYASTP